MGNDSTVVLSDEPLFLTDEEMAALADLSLSAVRFYRHDGRLPPGKHKLVEGVSYSGRRFRAKRTFTPVEAARAWFTADNRVDALAALDKWIADKLAASSVAGE